MKAKKASDSVNQLWSTVALLWLIDTAIRMMMMNMLVSSRQPTSVLLIVFWALIFIGSMIFSGETFRMVIINMDTNENNT